MDNSWILILKLIVISAILSVAIKYLAPLLNLPATDEIALGFVLAPTIFLAAALCWRQLSAKKAS
jgi:hypothetical protein